VTGKHACKNTHTKTFCRMCSHHCAIEVVMEKEGKIKEIKGNVQHPFNEGRLCVKGRAILDLIYSPKRLLKPLKKVGNQWQEIELDMALHEISQKMQVIKDRDGAKSIGIWKGEAIGGEQQRDLSRRFALAFGTPNMFSNDTLCAVSKKAAIRSVIGTYPTPDFLNAKCIVVWGSNPLAAQFPLSHKIIEARKRGAKVILIDPRKSGFAKHADFYCPIVPATDGALALGIINGIIENNWYDVDFVGKHTVGFLELADYARQFTLDYVEAETGINRDDIYKISKIIAESAPEATYMVGVGLEHHDNGFNNIRAIACIGGLCGCTDRPGGDMLPEKANLNSLTLGLEDILKEEKPIGAEEFPVFYDNHQEGHTIRAMEAILKGQPYPLRGLILTGANPVLTNPNAKRVKKALKSLDLLVVRDLFMTDTAKLADYVLPAASFLERSEIISDGMLQSISLTKKVLEFPLCQDEYQFWHGLAEKLGIAQYFSWKDEEELNRWRIEPLGLSLEELAAKPEGYSYKDYRYEKFKTHGFATPSGKVEFVSDYLEGYGYERLPVYKQAKYLGQKGKGQYDFVLITGARLSRFNHSCYQHIPQFKKVVPRPMVEIHPQDASTLGISHGDWVEVTSATGSLQIMASVVGPEEILPGFLQITHGFEEYNVNTITLDDVIDPVSGFPAVKSVPVKITRLE
jgi:formate dehydrogenase (coenzyme F420) alpha subunit